MRLDKLLSSSTAFTRSLAKVAIKKGKVKVDGVVVKNHAQKVAEDALVEYMGVSIKKPKPQYIMFHKPAGVVCANSDEDHETVFDSLFLPRVETLHIAGRLDIDTTGLILITDDGQWSHRVTSPKHNHEKSYLIDLDTPITEKQIRILSEGVQLKAEEKRCLPAQIEVLSELKIRMTITEGKYHQVKRMMAAVGNHVEKLHREQIGKIKLDESLKENQWRELTAEEIELV
ncbi:16S rRNA pseudouridine(516) synthase RsuA [Cocleimonas flava]|uniref:Pseudouridine synthase n=1 Tax=Cocleimonas flava TaxID=634765 RepID=A0A4R1EUD2_9GAMM|nr:MULTISPECIES: pseudouridine synthase [Cocleimonas]MEB8433640.1 pseudouridine synthase [Cocleimonas sp. KMM 6892]MEC4716451.1 pseudouridine synthase [Cocleimonas sp. KMM 6895]MEC4745656.1 pseudouridine synthase [Cocleimonas sp. KMM 6896]TCJ85287.1 ribosomal small subunit pseudouridine synthase A [Cocleimonas flava]